MQMDCTLTTVLACASPLLVACYCGDTGTSCRDGVLPYDGRTAVALDAEVRIDFANPIDPEHSSLRQGITFIETEDGTPVRYSLKLDERGVTLTPRMPLKERTDIEVCFDRDALSDLNATRCSRWMHRACSRFTTKSALQVAAYEQDGMELTVEFSEPVRVEDATNGMRARDAEGMDMSGQLLEPNTGLPSRRFTWVFPEPAVEWWVDGLESAAGSVLTSETMGTRSWRLLDALEDGDRVCSPG